MKSGPRSHKPKLFSYVVEHDTGDAPNPYFDYCTLCICKYRKAPGRRRNVVELAEIGDWVVGTGGANLVRSAGNSTIVYAMKVTDKMTLQDYFTSDEFACKKPGPDGIYKFGDNFEPRTYFDKYERFVLVSQHFYYFGRSAISAPTEGLLGLEKKGQGFKSRFDEAYVNSFINWIENEVGKPPGKHGDPCWPLAGQKPNCPPCEPRTEPVCLVCG